MQGMACDFNLLFPVGFAEDKNNKNNNKNLLAVNGSKPLIHPEIFWANQKEDVNMNLGKKRPKSRPFTPWGRGGQGRGVTPQNQVAKHHFTSIFEDKDNLRRKQLLETSKQFYTSNL